MIRAKFLIELGYVPLTLISCTKFSDGVVKLHHAVRK
jgi:hypothetical protein